MKELDLPASMTSSHSRKVANYFSKAATQYENVAHLQRKIGYELLSLLNTNTNLDRILDLGCSTGYFIAEIKRLLPKSSILALDVAMAMLQQNSQRKSAHLVCANMEELPLITHSVDLIFANMSLQWSSQLGANFCEIKRILKSKGYLLFSVPGPQTLIELKQSWQAVDKHAHVNSFPDQSSLQHQLQEAGFKKIILKQKTYELEYPSVIAMMQYLKATGTDCVLAQRSSLTGKTKFKQMLTQYEMFRKANNLLPCTYEIIFGEAYS
ncbi:MAG TPA: malonyl-ACP O-methyltransferase BioC [Coxiellaceae bacterium]|nr:malonyl-ACP O-methyltransferase BioC [Coxiellaceae bacterium]